MLQVLFGEWMRTKQIVPQAAGGGGVGWLGYLGVSTPKPLVSACGRSSDMSVVQDCNMLCRQFAVSVMLHAFSSADMYFQFCLFFPNMFRFSVFGENSIFSLSHLKVLEHFRSLIFRISMCSSGRWRL